MPARKKPIDPNSPENWSWDNDLQPYSPVSPGPEGPRGAAGNDPRYNKGWADEGVKADDGKLPYHLVPGDALEEIVKVLDFGAKKYEAENWRKGMRWSRVWGAMMRHAWAWWRGEDKDPETGLSHLAHLGCGCLFLIWFELHKVGADDRHKVGGGPG